MNEPAQGQLSEKIRRLVEERGWNQEELARIAGINRHTARSILGAGPRRKMRSSTLCAIATALNVTVSELRGLPLEALLPRMAEGAAGGMKALRRRQALAKSPDLQAWLERNPRRASELSLEEVTEAVRLLSEGRCGSPEEAVSCVEKRRMVLHMASAVAASEHLDLLEQLVRLLYDKVHPPGG
jgi:transcriptional regulator with XRE-family HTH domain